MKKVLMAAAVMMAGAGCVGTYVKKTEDGGFRGYRLAVLYPFEVESIRVVSSNSVYELSHYKTEGANSNTVAVMEGIARGVAEGVVKGLK